MDVTERSPGAETDAAEAVTAVPEEADGRRPIIHTEGLTKTYGTKVAVSDLNLDIYPGEIFGLLGPSRRSAGPSSA